MKYIDTEKLLAEISKRMGEYDVQQITSEHPEYEQGAQDALYNLKLQLTSLQQEQPEADLEKEIEKVWEAFPPKFLDFAAFTELVTHFYKLGLNARKED